MSRKIFISFLGVNGYSAAHYFYNNAQNQTNTQVFYAQQAIAQLVAKDWSAGDAFYVFTTREAFMANWLQRTKNQQEGGGTEPNGLAHHLAADFKGSIEPVQIPEGNSHEELWKIFQIIADRIQDGDEVHLDITYSFRSLPTFATTLLNYAKHLKNITIGGIYYANFEGRNATNGVAQILNLAAIERLQRWTSASEAFIQAGNAALLAQLIREEGNADLARKIEDFTLLISTARGFALSYKFDVNQLKTDIQQLSAKQIDLQLQLILSRIANKISKFTNNSSNNGLFAVEWCVEHNLIQAGFTFLQETLKSMVLERSLGPLARRYMCNFRVRQLAGDILFGNDRAKIADRIHGKQLKPVAQEVHQKITQMVQFVQQKNLIPPYAKLIGADGLRNDINHAGYLQDAATPRMLRQELQDILRQVKQSLGLP